MDEFKEKIINEIVESKKIHAILKILVDYNPDLFVINGSDIKDEITLTKIIFLTRAA